MAETTEEELRVLAAKAGLENLPAEHRAELLSAYRHLEGMLARIRRDRALRRARLADILPRHDAAFAAAESALREAAVRAGAATVRPGDSAPRLGDVELVASLLRAALDALGEVAGPMHPDEVLGLVFSRFCIGK